MTRDSADATMRRTSVFVDRTWFFHAVMPVEMPVGLKHFNSEFCWCEPLIELDDDDHEVIVHKEVTWN